MTPPALDRRRLLAGAGAVVALGAAAGCAGDAGEAGRAAARAAGRASSEAPGTASGTAAGTPSPTPSATVGAAPPSPTPSRAAGAAQRSAPARPVPVSAPRLADRLEDYLAGRHGELGLELVDLRRGQSFSHDAGVGYCYSTIKVLVLTTLLSRLQKHDAQLSARQHALATRMITRSDNAATETLLAEVGRDEVRRVAGLVGMEHTEMDDGWWGLWRTVPGDLNRMVGAVLSSDAVLDGSRRAVARFLMADVVPEQRWGVFAPESSRVHVAAKNGWGPLPDGYRLNSVGWVSADDREYQLAILSTSPRGFRYGRRTISEVAQICHAALADGLT